MKSAQSLALGAAALTAAFLIGRWTAPVASGTKTDAPAGGLDTLAQRPHGATAPAAARTAAERSGGINRISESRAQRMTPAERMDLLAKGALVFDGTKQAEMLCGLIAALTKEEMRKAMDTLAQAQDGGNACVQAVWDALWTQWGRVDPVGCLKYLDATSGNKSRSDVRHAMEGWLETDPGAALAWAREPKQTRLDASAAALAMTRDAGGDPERLKEAILARPPGDMAAKDCLWDYFDLASLSKENPNAGQIYDNLPPSLQEAAWSVTLRRLIYTNPQSAKDWLQQHAGDPGRDYQEAQRLVLTMSQTDPEGTAKWAAALPVIQGVGPHPATMAISHWIQSDPEAANAWIETLPTNSPWARSR
jgi:hypothetical protein